MKARLLLSLAVVLIVAPAGLAQTPAEKKATIAYLLSLESSKGGFTVDARSKEASLRSTNASLRALKYFGGKPGDVEACKKFVLSCFDPKTGSFADAPGGKGGVVLTAIGLMAIVELKLPADNIEKPAIDYMEGHARTFEDVRMVAAGLEAIKKRSSKNAQWLAELARRQNDDGTFGKGKGLARDTGSAIACVLRLGGKIPNAKGVVAALDKAQNADGGFGQAEAKGSDLGTSYRVVRSYVMLGAKPARASDLKRFIARCRNADGGYGDTPGATTSPAGTYFAAILLYWLDAK